METREVKLRLAKMFSEAKSDDDAMVLYIAMRIVEKYENIEAVVYDDEDDEEEEEDE